MVFCKRDFISWQNIIFRNAFIISPVIFTHISVFILEHTHTSYRESCRYATVHISTPPSLCLVKCLEGPSKPSAKVSFILSVRKRFSQLFQGSLDSFPSKQCFMFSVPEYSRNMPAGLNARFTGVMLSKAD